MNLNLLKEVLAVPTKTGEERRMIVWLVNYFTNKGIPVTLDPAGNVYATKGKLEPGEYYPCVIAHTDSVHEPIPVTIQQPDEDTLIAVDEAGRQAGLGGDDKAGIYLCLELMERFPKIKGAFFISEEIGCIGSEQCDMEFFKDVGHAAQFDSPCDTIMTYTCNGVQLFPDHGPYHGILREECFAHNVTDWQHHPYTDASVIKRENPFPCLNLPAGYFRMHTKDEYVSLAAITNSISLGTNLFQRFGCQRYTYTGAEPSKPSHRVTHIECFSEPLSRRSGGAKAKRKR